MNYIYTPIQTNLTSYTPNVKYIYHHLGLGDHIILNGLVRTLIEDGTTYYLFCKSHNEQSVKFMYRDLPNLKLIVADTDHEVDHFLRKIHSNNIIKIGFEYFNLYSKDEYFDRTFYSQFDLPIQTRWEKFKVDRDLDTELRLFESLGVEKGNYIFLQDDLSRGFVINPDFIRDKSLPIIKPHRTNTIFDWCTVIENAAEIHCICSSFKQLADNLNLKDVKLHYHITYVADGRPRDTKISYNNNNWINI